MGRLRVLITNVTLTGRTGTETYVRDLACGLLRRGHLPIVYSTDPGEMAREIEAATVPVIDDLAALSEPPDVIHGHHHAETLTALLHFPGVPAVHVCHSWGAWFDAPPRFPRLRRHVAVDDTCRDRLLYRHAIPAGQVRVIRNAVDLERFPPRGPLPPAPRRALVFSNMAAEDTHLGAVREACGRAGLALDVVGSRAGTSSARPGDLLGTYGLVFAKARCALEALAVGCAVVLCDAGGAGPLVTAASFAELRRLNFGCRALRLPVRSDTLGREIARYDAADAERVARRARTEANLNTALDELTALYREVIAEQRGAPPADVQAEGRAAAAGLRYLAPYFKAMREQLQSAQEVVRERDRWYAAHTEAAGEAARLRADLDRLRAACVPPENARAHAS